MNTLFILQRNLICELYYISVYFILLFFLMKKGFKCYAVISKRVLRLYLPCNYLHMAWQETEIHACIQVK